MATATTPPDYSKTISLLQGALKMLEKQQKGNLARNVKCSVVRADNVDPITLAPFGPKDPLVVSTQTGNPFHPDSAERLAALGAEDPHTRQGKFEFTAVQVTTAHCQRTIEKGLMAAQQAVETAAKRKRKEEANERTKRARTEALPPGVLNRVKDIDALIKKQQAVKDKIVTKATAERYQDDIGPIITLRSNLDRTGVEILTQLQRVVTSFNTLRTEADQMLLACQEHESEYRKLCKTGLLGPKTPRRRPPSEIIEDLLWEEIGMEEDGDDEERRLQHKASVELVVRNLVDTLWGRRHESQEEDAKRTLETIKRVLEEDIAYYPGKYNDELYKATRVAEAVRKACADLDYTRACEEYEQWKESNPHAGQTTTTAAQPPQQSVADPHTPESDDEPEIIL